MHGSWLNTEIPYFCVWTQQSPTLKTRYATIDSICLETNGPLALEEKHNIHLLVEAMD